MRDNPISQTTEASVEFEEIFNLLIDDASDRTAMWGDFIREFVRLGFLAKAMRGPPEITRTAFQAAKMCHLAMRGEVARMSDTIDHFPFKEVVSGN